MSGFAISIYSSEDESSDGADVGPPPWWARRCFVCVKNKWLHLTYNLDAPPHGMQWQCLRCCHGLCKEKVEKVEMASKKRRLDSALAFMNKCQRVVRQTSLIHFVFGSELDRVSNALWGIDMRLLENDLAIPVRSQIFIVAEYVYGPYCRFASRSILP